MMQLNTLAPATGAKREKKRLGRGAGSGLGKTGGRGHKGQRSRSGGYHKVGFEGGQMPLQRRLPKFGFISQKAIVTDEIRLAEIAELSGEITLETLRAAGLINRAVKFVKIFGEASLKHALIVKGLRVSKGARAAIEAAGGKVEAPIEINSQDQE